MLSRYDYIGIRIHIYRNLNIVYWLFYVSVFEEAQRVPTSLFGNCRGRVSLANHIHSGVSIRDGGITYVSVSNNFI